MKLLLTADLATAYFNLRQTDIELDVLAQAIDLQRRSLAYARTRHDLGAGSGLDVAQQQALIDTTLTQVDILRRQRALFEHALATLVGAPAPLFSIAPDAREMTPPPVPIGVPSDILQRRPDIAAAERAMAAANAQVGIANAAFYPSIVLGASAGQQSRNIETLLERPSLVASAKAAAEQSAADLETARLLLVADLATAYFNLRQTDIELDVLARSIDLQRRSLTYARTRYDLGAGSSLDVAQQQALLDTCLLYTSDAADEL